MLYFVFVIYQYSKKKKPNHPWWAALKWSILWDVIVMTLFLIVALAAGGVE